MKGVSNLITVKPRPTPSELKKKIEDALVRRAELDALSSAVFTRDEVRGLRFSTQVEAGMTHINGTSVDDTRTGPFGGEKNSGIGRFGGEWAIQEFTTDHRITAQHTPREYPF